MRKRICFLFDVLVLKEIDFLMIILKNVYKKKQITFLNLISSLFFIKETNNFFFRFYLLKKSNLFIKFIQ